jgi:hypothetical protein
VIKINVVGPRYMSIHQAVREIAKLKFSEEQQREIRIYLLKSYGISPASGGA